MIIKVDLPNELFRKRFRNAYLKAYPDFTVGTLGKSILGRDIDYYKFGSGKKNIVIVGAHHALEYITSLVIYDFISYISENLTRDACINGVNLKFWQQKFTYWLIPCLNPDGVELCLGGAANSPLYAREVRMNGSEKFDTWQANSRGVDLNHNYDYRFSEYKALEKRFGIAPGKSRYAGEYPESEPETRAMANLIRVLNPLMLVSLHSQGKEVYFQPKNQRIERIGKRIADAIGYEVCEPSDLALYGGLSDYAGAVLGIPSFTIEVGLGENPLPISSLPSICEKLRPLLIRLPFYM